ncbi:hypothetical protein [Halorarius halobius]|uniref:hypothetical protein n=1 Tax=Halorarius halobius TaxID=2962671 RepID=UPI0020CB9560|nr:hypothetical protein [Halorarius halobius]
MDRSFEISGRSLLYVFYAVSLAVLVPLLSMVVFPIEGLGDAALAALFAVLLGAGVVRAWRTRTDREPEHLGTAGDVAYDPIADPGQAAKHSWEKAVRRLPGRGDDEED